MSKKPETVFRERIRPHLNKLKNTHIFSISQTSISGTPDLLMCVAGRFVALELKSHAKAKVSALQIYNLNKIAGAGGISIVCHPENWEDIHSELIILSEKEPCLS